MRRSSTSSSEGRPTARPARRPGAGFVAAALVLLLDAAVLGEGGLLWRVAREPLGYAARDRQRLAALEDVRPERRLLVLGSSQAEAGFDAGLVAADARPDLEIVNLGRAFFKAYELRALAAELAGEPPAVVVVYASDFSTHGRLYLRPHQSQGRAVALAETVWALPPRLAWFMRTQLLRLGLDCALGAYRHRPALGGAGLDRLRRFPTEDGGRLRPASRRGHLSKFLSAPLRPPPAAVARLVAAFPDVERDVLDQIVRYVAAAGPGPQADVQLALFEGAVENLADAGVKVVIVETPLHPAAYALYDRSALRAVFLDLVGALARRPGVRFVPLEASGPWGPGDMRDVTHVDERGARKLTRAALAEVRDLLAAEAAGR